MYAIVKDDIVTGLTNGPIKNSVKLPDSLLNSRIESLRFDGHTIINCEGLERTYYIDDRGIKHVLELENTQPLKCKFEDILVKDETGKWIIGNDIYKLNNAKYIKKKEITAKFNNTLRQGYVCSNGIKMNATWEDITKLNSGYNLTLSLNQTEMIVRDYNNNNHTLTVEEVKNMLTELGLNYQEQLKKLWSLKDKVVKATTIEEVKSIKWEE